LGFTFSEGWELGFFYWDWYKYFEIWIGIVFLYPFLNPIRAQVMFEIVLFELFYQVQRKKAHPKVEK